jgi:hypothetical protein
MSGFDVIFQFHTRQRQKMQYASSDACRLVIGRSKNSLVDDAWSAQ